jgi:hypothetical protein
MTFLASLDAKDRRLLLWCVSIALLLAVAIGFLIPGSSSNSNPLPSSFLAGQHGARAAYETLLRSNYSIERWERPLADLAATAGPDTVVIFAEPFTREPRDVKAVRQILERGGRVLSTGLGGGFILPGDASETPDTFSFAACKLDPEGIDPLAGSGEVWMVPQAGWQVGNPAFHVEYACTAQPSVVEYDWGKGHVVWWASATPLENGSLARAHDLDLLLNSIGPRAGHHFYWDESLHGDVRSAFSYVAGPSWTMLWFGLPLLAVLVILSFSRRSGPVRELPPAVRATPIEFLEALGSLYRNAGASSIAVAIALERFRRKVLRLCGLRGKQMASADLAVILRRRFPQTDPTLEADLAACEEAARSEAIAPRDALKLIQKLYAHQEKIAAAAKPGATLANLKDSHPSKQERAS